MALVMLQLSVCILTLIQLTSSQSTYDVIQQENDDSRCLLSHLVIVNSQLQTTVSQLQSVVSQIQKSSQTQTNTSQLPNDNSHLMTVVSEIQIAVAQLQNTSKQFRRDLSEIKNQTYPVVFVTQNICFKSFKFKTVVWYGMVYQGLTSHSTQYRSFQDSKERTSLYIAYTETMYSLVT